MNNMALYCEGPLQCGLLWEHLRTSVRMEVSLPGSKTLIYCGTTALTLSGSNTAVCAISKYLYLSALSSLLLEGFLWLWGSAGCSLVVVLGLLIVGASLVEHRL